MRGPAPLRRGAFLAAAALLCAGLGAPSSAQDAAAPPDPGGRMVNLMTGKIDIHDEESRRVSVRLAPGIRSSRDIGNANLVRARRAIHDGRPVSLGTLRALADLGDGNAAFKFAKTLDALEDPALGADIAHYYAMAAATGRAGALFGLVRSLQALDPTTTGPARLSNLREVLIAYARAGNSIAVEAMIRFHVAGTPFGPLDDELERLAAEEDAPGAPLVALQLATQLMQDGWSDRDTLMRAAEHMETAGRSPSLRLRLIVDNMRPILAARLETLASVAPAAPNDALAAAGRALEIAE